MEEENQFKLTGGLVADELPEGRAIYDINDKFSPTGRDLLNPLSWLPGPVGGIAGGADAYHSARENGINPLAAGLIGTGIGAIGTFGLLGPLSKFLPKGKRGGYLRLGSAPGEIISDTGKKFNVGENINTKDLVNDANAYQKFYEKMDPDDLADMIDEGEVPYWLAGKGWRRMGGDKIDEVLYDNLSGNLNSIPESYINNLDKDAKIAYNKLEPINNKSLYSHFSETPLSSIERGYTGGQHGDNLMGGPTSGIYMVDKGTELESPYMNYKNEIFGPANSTFINGDLTFDKIPKDLKEILLKKGNLTVDDVNNSALLLDIFNESRREYPYINRLLRSKGYAGTKRTHEPYYGRDEFTEYLGFYPEDFNIVNTRKIKRNK